MTRLINTRFILILILLLAASGCAATRAIKEGDKLAAAEEWDEAVLNYSEAYQKAPGNLEYRIKYMRARFLAAQIHYGRGEEHLVNGKHEAAMLEFQAALLLDTSLDKARTSMKKTKRLMDSIYYYGKGVDFLSNGYEREARAAFKRALKLNPKNHAASVELEKLRKHQKIVMDGYELDIKSTKPITLEFRSAEIKKIFEVISKLSGINFVYDSDLRDKRISIFLRDASFQQAMELVLMASDLSRKVVSENTIIIYPDTPQKAKQYEEMMVKVFYLTNVEAKKTVNLLRTMLKARDIVVHEDLNAIIIRDRPEAIELAQKILDVIDLADSEVMLEVNVMEIKRNKESNLGVDLSPDTVTASVPTTGGTITLGDLKSLSSGELLIGLPDAILNIKKEDLEANILANPSIRVKNKGRARIHIGDKVPIITTTVNQGVSTESIQYLDVGLKLDVEPTIRKNDEINLKIGLEVSSLGTKTVTTSGSVTFQIGTRNMDTVLSLHDGETQIIGGLISDEERKTVAKVPFLGEIPVLGRLFASVDNSTVKTEILLSITPHIVRRLDVPEETATGFLSGSAENPSARPLLDALSPETEDANHVVGPGVRTAPVMPYSPLQTPEAFTLQPIPQRP